MSESPEILRKKLRIRAWRRGFKEADLILGRFCDDNIDGMSPDELLVFEQLLDQQDQDLYGWIIGREPTPEEFDTPIMDRVKAYRPHTDAAFGDGPKG
ncbi:succinate dehydrogenase assembly factor 2 [Maricaulis parjimensis]|uniref:FAD assembly factor SdhE n=1 Tax=Maricaulis parjimensis TaxID=144023 RepID=UPI000C48A6DA|nr:succinate dehydrogenase assembly factor 2 [Maricaulis parjimensis]MAK63615.1 succinate dehydrogenase assembly factor 2 [Maricaulis sp.]|tara:strand:- start:520 stop:813 length:294 start_codon:yes stop_codon:yes gene_type:complete